MDRRQFAPSAEGLEGRALLSSFAGSTRYHHPHNIPVSYLTKTDRIKNLPFFLGQYHQDRAVPHVIAEAIQADLTAIRGKLHDPSPIKLNEFNQAERHAIPTASLSPAASLGLQHTFGTALESAGATATQIENLQADVNRLVQVDSTQRNPSFVATNDYAVILEVALGVGRPIHTPATPHLSGVQRVIPKNPTLTNVRQPEVVGTYDANSTISLVDNAGDLLGSTTVPASGRYVVQPTQILSNGTYSFRVIASDPGGDYSLPSAPLTVIIGSPNAHPRGPLGTVGH